MKRKIEGYYDFQDGDLLVVNGVVKAQVREVKATHEFILFFSDDVGTSMYVGKKGPHADDILNAVWTALTLKW